MFLYFINCNSFKISTCNVLEEAFQRVFERMLLSFYETIQTLQDLVHRDQAIQYSGNVESLVIQHPGK